MLPQPPDPVPISKPHFEEFGAPFESNSSAHTGAVVTLKVIVIDELIEFVPL